VGENNQQVDGGQGGSRRVGALVAAALSLIAVVAFASRSEPPRGGSEDGGQVASTLLANGVLLVMAIVGAGLLVLVVYSFSIGRVPKPPARPGTGLLTQFVMIAVVMGAIMYWRSQADTGRPDQVQEELELAPILGQTTTAPVAPPVRESPALDWRLIAVAFGGALIVFAVAGGLWVRAAGKPSGESALARRLSDVFDETLADLRAERDPRRAVIAAYARMEQLLGREGLPRSRAEAPHEYVARVLGELAVSGSSIERLTGLYEEARFSEHEVGAGMKEDAIAAVEDIRDQLRAPVAEPQTLTPEAAT
jgi:hypothetical protein